MTDHWSEAECYFAVWAYDQLDIDRRQVKRELYRRVSRILGRSENAVAYKIQNVASFDHRPREEKPVSEATHAQALLGEVFERYWADRERARDLLTVYFQWLQFGTVGEDHQIISTLAQKEPRSLVIEEGASDLSVIHRRKRSRVLLERGRRHFRELDPEGKLRCATCGFATPGQCLKSCGWGYVGLVDRFSLRSNAFSHCTPLVVCRALVAQ